MRLYFSPSIEERDWHVWRPVVKLGEYRSQFFFYVDQADADCRELIVPPRGLYGKEFLRLDYRDPFQLMAFQQKWGPITGLRARPNTTYDYESAVDVACIGGIAGLGKDKIPAGARETVFLFEGYGKADIVAQERFGLQIENLRDIAQRNWLERCSSAESQGVVPCHIASVQEVSEAVCHAQMAITAITDCLRDDFSEDDWRSRKQLVMNCLNYCNAAIQGSVVPIDLIDGDDNQGICTIMQYLFICMARGTMRNETYRNCQNPDCGRLFTPEEYHRRADSRYCSQECQVKAKHLRTYKPKRKAQKTIEPTPNSVNELTLSWSESNVPVRSITRGAHDKATEYSFIGFTCGNPDHEGYIAQYGLDIPNPSAQKCLYSLPV